MGFVCFIFLEGKKHDAGMLADSGLLNLLQSHAVSPFGQPMCILEIRSLHLTYKPLNASMSTSFFGMAVWCYCKLFQIC